MGGGWPVVRARAGKDAKDHLAAGYRLADLVPASERRLVRAARAYLSGAIERAEHSGYLRSAGRLAAIRLFLPNKKLRTA